MAAVGPDETMSWVSGGGPMCPRPAQQSGALHPWLLRSGVARGAAAPRTASAGPSISLGTRDARQEGVT